MAAVDQHAADLLEPELMGQNSLSDNFFLGVFMKIRLAFCLLLGAGILVFAGPRSAVPGSAGRTKTPICCYDNTSPAALTCPAIRKRSWTKWRCG